MCPHFRKPPVARAVTNHSALCPRPLSWLALLLPRCNGARPRQAFPARVCGDLTHNNGTKPTILVEIYAGYYGINSQFNFGSFWDGFTSQIFSDQAIWLKIVETKKKRIAGHYQLCGSIGSPLLTHMSTEVCCFLARDTLWISLLDITVSSVSTFTSPFWSVSNSCWVQFYSILSCYPIISLHPWYPEVFWLNPPCSIHVARQNPWETPNFRRLTSPFFAARLLHGLRANRPTTPEAAA